MHSSLCGADAPLQNLTELQDFRKLQCSAAGLARCDGQGHDGSAPGVSGASSHVAALSCKAATAAAPPTSAAGSSGAGSPASPSMAGAANLAAGAPSSPASTSTATPPVMFAAGSNAAGSPASPSTPADPAAKSPSSPAGAGCTVARRSARSPGGRLVACRARGWLRVAAPAQRTFARIGHTLAKLIAPGVNRWLAGLCYQWPARGKARWGTFVWRSGWAMRRRSTTCGGRSMAPPPWPPGLVLPV